MELKPTTILNIPRLPGKNTIIKNLKKGYKKGLNGTAYSGPITIKHIKKALKAKEK